MFTNFSVLARARPGSSPVFIPPVIIPAIVIAAIGIPGTTLTQLAYYRTSMWNMMTYVKNNIKLIQSLKT